MDLTASTHAHALSRRRQNKAAAAVAAACHRRDGCKNGNAAAREFLMSAVADATATRARPLSHRMRRSVDDYHSGWTRAHQNEKKIVDLCTAPPPPSPPRRFFSPPLNIVVATVAAPDSFGLNTNLEPLPLIHKSALTTTISNRQQ